MVCFENIFLWLIFGLCHLILVALWQLWAVIWQLNSGGSRDNNFRSIVLLCLSNTRRPEGGRFIVVSPVLNWKRNSFNGRRRRRRPIRTKDIKCGSGHWWCWLGCGHRFSAALLLLELGKRSFIECWSLCQSLFLLVWLKTLNRCPCKSLVKRGDGVRGWPRDIDYFLCFPLKGLCRERRKKKRNWI